MVAIVSGAGLGLLDSSANQLNGAGVLGSGALGQARGNGYVNLATGNLILQFTDETLSGSGADIRHLRTYNSLGTVGDGDNDRWRWLGEKRLTLSGTLNAAGSKVTRTTGDGHAAVYTWNAGRKAYVSAEGNGADDTIVRSGSEWVWTEGTSKVVERYNASTGWIKNSRDTSGNGFNYSFSGNLLTRISDAVSGQTLDLKYSSNRLVRVETRPTTSGAVTQQVHYSYDSSGRLSKVTTDLTLNNSISDGNTYVTTYTYDGSSTRVKSISQSDGTSVNYTYINSGGSYKVRTVTDQTGVTTFTYNSGNTQVKNGEGETTTYFYDSQQRLTRVNSHAVGGKTQSIQYAYDSKDNVIKVTDGKGKAITYTYDSRSNLTKEVDALGNTIERTYSNDRMVTETRFVGGEAQTTRLAYDSKGRLRYTVSAEGHISENRYDARGQVVLSIKYVNAEMNVSGLAKTTALTESQMNTFVSKVNKAETEVSKFDYNHRGQLISQYDYGTVDSNGNGVLDASTVQTEYVYSAYGELLQTISVTGNDRKTKTTQESRVYDGMGRVLSVVNDKGTTTTSYAARKVTVKQSASGLTVASAFDSRGKLINITSSGSGVNRIIRNYYDNTGRLVMTQSATGGRAYTIYDDAGRISHRVSEVGAVTGYLYDENGRVTETREYQNKVNTSGWFNGSVVSQKTLSVSTHGSDRITRYAYDNSGRLVTTTEEFGSNDRVTTTAYDSASQVTSTTVSGTRTTRYFYDRDGRVVGTLNGENYLTENVYDNAGRLSTVVRYGKKSTVNTTLQAIKNTVDDGNIQTTHYFYDAQGRQIGVLNEQGFLTETIYDIANRKTITQTFTKPLDALTFRNQTGVSLDAHTGEIKKTTSANSWDDAGFESENILAANTNGWAQITASETNKARMFGLNRTSDGVNNSYNTIDYAIYLRHDGHVYVYENGANKGKFKAFKADDVLRVERVGTTIYYKHNGAIFYTSTVTTGNALRVDGSIHHPNGTFKDIEGSFFSAGVRANTQAEFNRIKSLVDRDTLTFRGQAGVSIDPQTGDIKKTLNTNNWGDAGLESENVLAANTNGWVQFTASETNTYRMLGLNRASDDVSNHYNTIDYAIYTRADGYVHVYESGASKGKFSQYKAGDVLRVERVGTTIYYKHNGKTFYTSTVKTGSELRLDTSIHSANGTIKKIEGSFFNVATHDNAEADLNRVGAVSLRNQSGVSFDPLTKEYKKTLSTNNWGDAGFESDSVLAANTNGWVQFTASETNTYRMLGLNKASDGVNNNYNTIDYAIYTRADGYVHVYENGSSKGKFNKYKAGDILRVERVGTTLYYKQNGTTFYTSTIKTSGALRMDASIHSANGTIKNIEGSFFNVSTHDNAQAELNRISPLSFRTREGVDIDPHTGEIKKILGANNWGDAGVESDNILAANANGWVQFTATETNTYRMLGLNKTSDGVNNNYNTIDYAIYLRADGFVHVYESGASKGKFNAYKPGDVLRVERVGTTLYYKQNGKTFYTSTVKTGGALRMDASIHSANGTLKNIEGSFFRETNSHITVTHFDTRGRVSTVTNREGTKTRNIYDSAGRLSKTIVAEGTSDQTATRTRYNAFGEATGIVSGVGEAAQSNINTAIDQYGTEYKYDLMGRKIVEEGPQGQKTFFYYDAQGRLTYTVNALGEVSHTTYTTFSEAATVTVLAGRISVSGLTGGSENSTLINRVNAARNGGKDQKVTNTYNQLGLLASSTNGEGKRTTYGYDKLGDLRDVYTPFSGSNTTRQHLVYDKLGRVIHSYANHDSIRAQTTTYFDGFGQVVRVNDANGKNHYTDYLDNGRTIRQRDPLGRQQTTTFDALGREVTMTDQNGQKTTYTYSNSSRSVIVTTPEGIQLTTWSTRTGQILQVRDGNGGITKYTYDKDGNLKTTTNPLGKVTTNTYDKSGRLYETKNANGHIVRYSYDAANRTVQEAIDPTGLNLRTHYTFDGIGQTIDVRKGHGTSAAQRTQFIYDRNGRVKQEIIDPTGLKLSTRYTYDDAGNQIKMERGTTASPAQQVVQYKYDELGRRTEEILDPAGLKLSTKFRYDKNGNLTRTINARGHSTWHIYNAANEKTYDVNALGQVVRYDYDAKGNLHHVREYYNKVSVSGWGDVRTSVGSLSTNGQDRRSYTIRDDDGRERFTLTTVDGSNWVATENVLDKNNNMIESRRFDRYVTNARVSTMVGSSSSQKGVITDAEMIAQLRATGYKARAWGDSTDTLISTRRTRFAYDKANRLRFTVDANGYLSENIYDNVGNVRFQTQFTLKPNSLGTNYSESYINSRKRTHSLDRKTEFRYDRANRLQYELSASVSVKASNNVVYAGQLKKRTHYDALGQVTKVEEGIIDRASGSDITIDRRTTVYQYDKAGNQIKTILAGWYDRGDQRIYQNQSGQSDRFQRTIEVKYDALGNAVRNRIRTGASTYVYQYKAYDAIGRELYDIDAEGYVSGKTYDAHGNITAETRFNERKSGTLPSRGYWTAAEIASDMASDNSERIIRHTYNALGQKTRTLMPSSGVNYTSSSSTSAKTPATMPSGTKYTAAPETRYEYNVFGEVVKQRVRVDKTRWADSYTYYDNIGRTVLTVDPLRYGTKTEYNALGNVTKTREYYNKGTGTVSVTAKPSFAGHSKDRVQLFSYDAMGRVTRVQQERVAAVTLNKSTLRYSGVSTGTKTIATNTYNAFGDIHTSKDGLNNETRYDYNALGLVTKVTEPSRKMASKQVDPFRSQVTTRPTTTFTYDVFGNVRSEVRTASSSALGGAIGLHKVYDHAGNLVRSTNGQGHHTDYRIDVNGRTVKQTQGVSVSASQSKIAYSHTLETRYEYDKVGRQTTTLNVYSNSQSGTRHVYNAFGEVIREEKLRGSKNTATGSLTKATFKFYAYDAAGRVTYTRGTEGYTYFYYDLNNNVTRQEHRGTSNTTSGARVTEAYYDILGRATLQRLPYHTGTNNGARVDPKIRQSYDRWGNVLSRTDASNRTTTYTYNHTNQVTSERAPNVTTYRENNTAYTAYVTRTIDYDVAGRAAVEKHIARNTSGNAITTQKSSYQAYDEAGNVIRRVDATGKKTDFVYDIHNNKVGVRNGVGTVNVFDYDRNGNVIKQSLLRREDKVTTTTVNHQYGSYTNTTVTKLEYNGLVSSHTAKKKVQLNRFAYDQAGRRYAEFSSANKAEYYRYDQRGNIVLKQNVVGVQTRTTYDEFNNKTSEQQKVRLFSHNDRTEVTVPGGYGGSHTYFTNTPVYKDVWIGDNWEYSKSSYTFGRLTKRTYVIDAVTASNIKKNTFSYSYTRFNELYREASNANQFVQYAYWQNGLLRSKTDQQATNKKTTSTFHYDIRGLKTQEQHASNDTTSYTGYGGQVYTSNTNTNVKTIYSYDALGRLTKVVSPNGTFKTAAGTRSTANVKDLSYRYDEWGNRRAVIAKYRLTGSSSDRTTAYYYKYDAEGRVLVNEGMIASGKIVAGRYRGTAYTYDGAGRIATEEKWQYDLSPQYGSGGKTFFTRKKNTYNGFGLLESVAKASVTRAYNANSSASGSTGNYTTIETYKYDNRGFRTESVINRAKTTTSYRDDGQVVAQTTRNSSNQITSQTLNYRYSAGGQLERYDFRHYDRGSYKFTNSYYYTYTGTYTGTQVKGISVTSTQKGTAKGVTNNYYDYRGRLVSSRITEANRKGDKTGFSYKYFAYNADDQIIGSHYKQYGESRPKVQSFIYHKNSPIADFGDNGVNITPIDSQYKAGGTPGSYTVKVGDTLTGIAQTLFGDSSLWYVLAEANALNIGPTDRFTQSDAGRTLRVPNTDQALRNNSTTFKPYNPTEIIGDLTPDAKILPPPKSKGGGCNVLAIILIVVVAVVVTIFTAGAAAVAMGAASGSLWGAGTAALAGSLGAAGVAAAAVGGFVGSLASQAVGVGLGVQDGISLRSAFASGLTSAFTAGLGAVASGAKEGSTAARVASSIKNSHLARGAFTYVAAQASNRLVGLDTKFSWKGLAASAVGSFVGNGIADEINFDALGPLSDFTSGVARGFLTGAATAKLSEQWAGGAKVDYGKIALDAFGNQIANSFVNSQPQAYKRLNGSKLQKTPSPAASPAANDSATPTTVESKTAQAATVAVDDRIESKRGADVVENVRGRHNGEAIEEIVVTGYRDGSQDAQFFFDGQRQTNFVRNGFDRDGDAIYVDKTHLARQTAIARQEWNAREAHYRQQRAQASDAVVINEPSFYDSALDTISDLRAFAQEAGDNITDRAVSARDSLVGAWDVVSTEAPLIWDSLVDTVQAYDAGKPKSFELAVAAGGEWKWGFIGYEYGFALNADGSGEYGGAWMAGSGVQELFAVGKDIYNFDRNELISRREFLRRVKDYVVPTGGFAEVSMLGSGTSDANIFMNGHSLSGDLTASIPLRGKKGSLYLGSNHGISFDPSGRIDGINLHKFQGFTLGVSSDKPNFFNPEFTYEYSSADGSFGASTVGRVGYEVGANFLRGTATVANMFANLPGVAYSAWNDQPIEITRFYNFRN